MFNGKRAIHETAKNCHSKFLERTNIKFVPGNKLVTLLGYDNIVSHMQSTPFQEYCTGSAKKQPKNLSLTLQHTHHFLRQFLKARVQTFAMRMNFDDKQVFSVVMVVVVRGHNNKITVRISFRDLVRLVCGLQPFC